MVLKVSFTVHDPTACFSPRLRDADFPVQFLPRVVSAPFLAGTLHTSWHHVPQGTPVGVAMGDLQCSILSTNPSPSDASK